MTTPLRRKIQNSRNKDYPILMIAVVVAISVVLLQLIFTVINTFFSNVPIIKSGPIFQMILFALLPVIVLGFILKKYPLETWKDFFVMFLIFGIIVTILFWGDLIIPQAFSSGPLLSIGEMFLI